MIADLVGFLRARLDEDERAALATDETMGSPQRDWVAHPDAEPLAKVVANRRFLIARELGIAEAEHIARHDPARALREVEAKRQLVARHAPHSIGGCRTCERSHWGMQVCDHCERTAPCPDLRDLGPV
ncbi:DUF6221 family protein [Streptomyces sp. B1I3]|uniref:DUF6221 family protein n=1 Tax=Streptomyces sp. B1I3 TaxID=3042264 RepID=UPI002783A0B8|nr:hypothetical protein [Streptomyces sp. B1I3]